MNYPAYMCLELSEKEKSEKQKKGFVLTDNEEIEEKT